jgi:ribosomal protein S18 acetylase RimI-like enzyme
MASLPETCLGRSALCRDPGQAEGMTRPALVVRTANPGDVQPVLDVHAEHGSRPDQTASAVEIETWHRMMATPDLSVYVAELDGAVVGTATTVLMPNVTYKCAPTLFIEAVVVRPAYRRRGVASAVLRKVLDDGRAAGCDKVQLLSHKRHASDGAHRLYISIGFAAEAEGFRLYLQAPAVV